MKNIEKNTRHRFVFAGCILVTLALAIICLPAASAETEGVLTYTLNGTEVTITKCDTSATSEQVADAFYQITSSSAISITSIGGSAFNGCTGLTEINLPDSVTSIESQAFRGCIGLESIVIPSNVTNIGSQVFFECTGLTSISVDSANPAYSSSGGVLFNKTGTRIIQYPQRNAQTSYTVPNGVIIIGEEFRGCTGLTNINIPDGVTSIGSNAFYGCTGLTSIDIPDGVTSIGSNAFYGCTGLTSIDIPDGVTSIGNYTFYGCTGLAGIDIPNSVKSIGSSAFYGCTGLASINIPEGVTSIGFAAFRYCSGLTDINIPGSVTSIDSVAFEGCTGLTSINISDGVASIGYVAFGGCTGLSSINIPDSVTSIRYSAFSGCTGLSNINISNSVTSIEHGMFYNCTGLTSITIPDSVKNIGYQAFDNCTALKSVNIPEGVTSIEYNAFSGCESLTSIVIPDGVTSIGDSAFRYCFKLASVVIPDSVTSIGPQAFNNCYLLTNINIPGDATSIGAQAFRGCSGLTSITVPAGVTSVGADAFYGCSKLTEIIIEHGMLDLPIYFLTETSFKNDLLLYVPTSVISVGGQPAFSFNLPTDITLSGKPIIYGVTESFIVAWAEANAAKGAKLLEINGKINRTDYDDTWRNVPYQHIIETVMPDNLALKFEIVNGELPEGLELMQKGAVYEGLTLLSGQFYGAPLKIGEFEIEVEVRIDVGTWNYLLDLQKITLSVDIPSDAVLLDKVNDYDITTPIGAIDLDGAYWVTVFDDQVYEIADADLNGDGRIERNFPDFVHFWIDGKVLARDTDYDADEGSTVVTVYAKTFQALDDGAVHTASAEFSIKGVQTVAAQNFRVNLPEPVPEEKPDPDPEPEPEPDPDLNTNPDPDTEPGSDPEPDPEQEPNTDPDPDTEPGSDLDPNTDPDTAPEQNTPLPGGVSGGGYTTAAPAQPGPELNSPAVLTTPSDTSTADETPVAPVIAPEALITIAEDTNTAGGDTNPAGTAGAAAIDGLPRNENGLFYFVLDGSGAPLEARIDIPLADFADMYFDGELWMPGEDYETREGSTILVIAAEKLAGLTYGLHEISARFTEDRTVSFAFDLRGPAPAAGPETGPAAPAENAVNAALTAGSGLPAVPFVIAAVAVVLLIVAALVLRARRLRRAG